MCERVHPPLGVAHASFKACSLKEAPRYNTVAGRSSSPRQAVRGRLGAERDRPAAGGAVKARARRDVVLGGQAAWSISQAQECRFCGNKKAGIPAPGERRWGLGRRVTFICCGTRGYGQAEVGRLIPRIKSSQRCRDRVGEKGNLPLW